MSHILFFSTLVFWIFLYLSFFDKGRERIYRLLGGFLTPGIFSHVPRNFLTRSQEFSRNFPHHFLAQKKGCHVRSTSQTRLYDPYRRPFIYFFYVFCYILSTTTTTTTTLLLRYYYATTTLLLLLAIVLQLVFRSTLFFAA